jgi:hypothetical protein
LSIIKNYIVEAIQIRGVGRKALIWTTRLSIIRIFLQDDNVILELFKGMAVMLGVMVLPFPEPQS